MAKRPLSQFFSEKRRPLADIFDGQTAGPDPAARFRRQRALAAAEAQGPFGLRPDGTKKGFGFLGELPVSGPEGEGVTTEFTTQSNAVKVDGKRIEFPSLVPTLSWDEINTMTRDIIPNRKPIPDEIMQKAVDHAIKRLSENKSVFIEEGEAPGRTFKPGDIITSEDFPKDWSLALARENYLFKARQKFQEEFDALPPDQQFLRKKGLSDELLPLMAPLPDMVDSRFGKIRNEDKPAGWAFIKPEHRQQITFDANVKNLPEDSPLRKHLPKIEPDREFEGFWDETTRAFQSGSMNVVGGLAGTAAAALKDAGLQTPILEEFTEKLYKLGKQKRFQPAEDGGLPAFIAQSVGQALPYMVASMAATMATGTPLGAFAVGYSVEGDNSYRTAIELGATEEQANMNRAFVGTINGVIEAFQVSNVIRFAKAGKGSAKAFAKAVRQRAWSEVKKRGKELGYLELQLILRESLEEGVQEIVTIGGEARFNPEALKGAVGRVSKAAAGGGIVGGLFGAGGMVGGFDGGTQIKEPIRDDSGPLPSVNELLEEDSKTTFGDVDKVKATMEKFGEDITVDKLTEKDRRLDKKKPLQDLIGVPVKPTPESPQQAEAGEQREPALSVTDIEETIQEDGVTSEDFELKPDRMEAMGLEKIAIRLEGKVIAYEHGEDDVFNHADILQKHGTKDTKTEDFDPGFVDKHGRFIEQYGEGRAVEEEPAADTISAAELQDEKLQFDHSKYTDKKLVERIEELEDKLSTGIDDIWENNEAVADLRRAEFEQDRRARAKPKKRTGKPGGKKRAIASMRKMLDEKKEAVTPKAADLGPLEATPNIPIGTTEAKKQSAGRWKLFFRGTRNEVFPGEEFKSAAEAKQFFKVKQLKAKAQPTKTKAEERKAATAKRQASRKEMKDQIAEESGISTSKREKLKREYSKRIQDTPGYADLRDPVLNDMASYTGGLIDFGANYQDAADYAEGKPYLEKLIKPKTSDRKAQPWDSLASEMAGVFNRPDIADMGPSQFIEFVDTIESQKEGRGLNQDQVDGLIAAGDIGTELNMSIIDWLDEGLSAAEVNENIDKEVDEYQKAEYTINADDFYVGAKDVGKIRKGIRKDTKKESRPAEEVRRAEETTEVTPPEKSTPSPTEEVKKPVKADGFGAKLSDVDLDRATNAYRGISFSPEKRGKSEQTEYVADMTRLQEELEPLAKSAEQKEILATEGERYRLGYLKRLNALLGAKSRIMSTMITGPANFPTARNQKRNATADKRRDEFLTWTEKAEDSIRRKLQKQAVQDAGGETAVLEKQLATAEKNQETMKAINAIVRKKITDAAKIKKIVAETDFTEDQAKKLLKPDRGEKQGFQGFQLTNNRANIKRMQTRLKDMRLADSRSGSKTVGTFDGGEIINNFDAERIQIVFDEKPTGEKRTALKSRGFRWSPRYNAWQRKNTNNGLLAARQVVEDNFEGFERIVVSEKKETELEKIIGFARDEVRLAAGAVKRGEKNAPKRLLDAEETLNEHLDLQEKAKKRAEKVQPKARPKDLLGREELQGGAAGKQTEFLDKADFKTVQEQQRINAKGDIKGQDQLFPKGFVVLDILSKMRDFFLNTLQIEPSKAVERVHGKTAYEIIIKGIHRPDVARLEFNETEIENMVVNVGEMAELLGKYGKETLTNLMASRGKPVGIGAQTVQREALEALPKELFAFRRVINKIADLNYKYLRSVVGKDVGFVQDYFYGIYKNNDKVDRFLDYWKTTKRFIKRKHLPTVADAISYGLELRDPNPVHNLMEEYMAISRLDGMIWMRDAAMAAGKGKWIDNKETAPTDWEMIKEPVLKNVRFSPDAARMIKNLLSVNKITRQPIMNRWRQFNNAARTFKFALSMFHHLNIVKQSFVDTGYFKLFTKTSTRGLTKGFRKNDPRFKTPEYKDYIAHGGGHQYSIESEAARAMKDFVDKINTAGGVLGRATRIARTKAGRAAGKFISAPINIPTGYVSWLFQSFIPEIKYVKYLDRKLEMEKELGRPLKGYEKIDIIKEQQNFYGMMNERLLGRSGTATTILRFYFMAPGYSEGNQRTQVKAVTQWGFKDGFNASRSRSNIINSLLVSGITATIGTLIMTGKPPEMPETREDIRDLFKIDTGKLDDKGRRVMVDLLTFDKDYWNVLGQTLIGRPDKALTATIKRLSGMTADSAKMIHDFAGVAMGKAIYDYKGDRIVEITDTFTQKMMKVLVYEMKRLLPISTSVYARSRAREQSRVMSALTALAGYRTGLTEKDKREQTVLHRIWSLAGQQEELYYYLTSIKRPREAVRRYNDKVMEILQSPITPTRMRLEWSPKLLIDVDRLIENKAYQMTHPNIKAKDLARAQRFMANFKVTPEEAATALERYWSRPTTPSRIGPLERNRVIGRALKRKRLSERMTDG